jgi:ribonuclease T1
VGAVTLRLLARLARFALLCLLAAASLAVLPGVPPAQAREHPQAGTPEVELAALPREARETLALIRQGGPYPYSKDGTVFFNRERRLPAQPRGYYTEYTVRTPGARDRGARRIVAGGDAQRSGEYWYTDDHYRTFRRIRE